MWEKPVTSSSCLFLTCISKINCFVCCSVFNFYTDDAVSRIQRETQKPSCGIRLNVQSELSQNSSNICLKQRMQSPRSPQQDFPSRYFGTTSQNYDLLWWNPHFPPSNQKSWRKKRMIIMFCLPTSPSNHIVKSDTVHTTNTSHHHQDFAYGDPASEAAAFMSAIGLPKTYAILTL